MNAAGPAWHVVIFLGRKVRVVLEGDAIAAA
jgi:hypothetical protein